MANRVASLLLLLALAIHAAPYTIQDYRFEGNTLFLRFDRPIQEKDVRFFRLDSGGLFKNIYDLPAIFPKNFATSKLSGNISAKIAQNNNEKVRIVFFSSAKLLTNSEYDQNTLLISAAPVLGTATPIQDTPTKVLQSKVNGKTVVVDAGHGGKDCGAVSSAKVCEKKIVLAISKEAVSALQKLGYRAYLTRSKDLFLPLKKRTAIANDKLADAFVSVHVNAIPGKEAAQQTDGVETYFLSPARSSRAKNAAALENSEDVEAMNFFAKETFLNFLNSKRIVESNKLAIDVQQHMLLALGEQYKNVKDGGVREGPFWVLVGAQMPSVLIEAGYISHPDESKRLSDPRYQKQLGRGIAEGIDAYFTKNP